MSRTPKVVANALAPVGGAPEITLHEFSASTILLLQQIESPLIAEKTKKGRKADRSDREMTDLDLMRVVFLLARPPREAWELLRRSREAFDAAVIDFGSGVPLSALAQLGEQIQVLLARATSTAGAPGAAEKKTPSPADPAGSPKSPPASAGS